VPGKIFSRAQWGLLFAKAKRGQIHGGIEKVKEMAEGVNYSKLPEYKRKLRRKVIGRGD
jgi:hypothetical protein